MGKKVLFNSQEELDEFLFNTYGDGAYLLGAFGMCRGKFYGVNAITVNYIDIRMIKFNSKDELIEELNTIITETMPLDEFKQLGKLVKTIYKQGNIICMDAGSIDEIQITYKGVHSPYIDIDYISNDTIQVVYIFELRSEYFDEDSRFYKEVIYNLSDPDLEIKILEGRKQLLHIGNYYTRVESLRDNLYSGMYKTIRGVGYEER